MAVHGQTNWTEIEDEQYQNCRYPISLAETQVNTIPRFTRLNTSTVSPACLEFARFAVYPQGQNQQFNSPTLSPPLTPCVGGGNFMPFDGMQEHSHSYLNPTVHNNYVVESAHFALSSHHHLSQYYPLSPPGSCDNLSISLGYSDQGSPIFSEPTSPESRVTEVDEGRDMEDTFEDEDEPLYPRRRRACSEDGDYEMGDSHGQRRKIPLSVRQYSNEKYDSYAVIIYQALMSVPERKMILADIYDYYRKAQPERALKDDGWKNSIRHNLSMNGDFIKEPIPGDERRNIWVLSKHAEENGITPTTRHRLTPTRAKRRSQPARRKDLKRRTRASQRENSPPVSPGCAQALSPGMQLHHQPMPFPMITTPHTMDIVGDKPFTPAKQSLAEAYRGAGGPLSPPDSPPLDNDPPLTGYFDFPRIPEQSSANAVKNEYYAPEFYDDHTDEMAALSSLASSTSDFLQENLWYSEAAGIPLCVETTSPWLMNMNPYTNNFEEQIDLLDPHHDDVVKPEP